MHVQDAVTGGSAVIAGGTMEFDQSGGEVKRLPSHPPGTVPGELARPEEHDAAPGDAGVQADVTGTGSLVTLGRAVAIYPCVLFSRVPHYVSR